MSVIKSCADSDILLPLLVTTVIRWVECLNADTQGSKLAAETFKLPNKK